jgi:hypothetical protein
MSTALIRTNDIGQTRLILIKDDDEVEVTRLYRFDMSLLSPVTNLFVLTRKQNNAFLNALVSARGKEILYALKNKKTDEIINEYLAEQERQIGTYDRQTSGQNEKGCGTGSNIGGQDTRSFITAVENKESKLKSFVGEVHKTPLRGKNYISPITIGLSKKEIWEAFLLEGLI